MAKRKPPRSTNAPIARATAFFSSGTLGKPSERAIAVFCFTMSSSHGAPA